ncbi:MAG: cytochrome o ubiquinol oxidase subunit I, partial [Gammaproteobacteria bacterium]
PMYNLGFMGMTRRLDYVAHASWFPLLVAEQVGIGLFCIAAYYQFKQLYVSIRDRRHNRAEADAWGSTRTLEWMTHSPVPFYNFAVTPQIHARDEWAWRKERGLTNLMPDRFQDIHLPKNTYIPAVLGALAFVFGFAMVWRIWWLGALALLAIIGVVIWRSFHRDTGYVIPAGEVERMERGYLQHAPEGGTEEVPVGEPAPGVLASSQVPSRQSVGS